jgi:hypothetical protein
MRKLRFRLRLGAKRVLRMRKSAYLTYWALCADRLAWWLAIVEDSSLFCLPYFQYGDSRYGVALILLK